MKLRLLLSSGLAPNATQVHSQGMPHKHEQAGHSDRGGWSPHILPNPHAANCVSTTPGLHPPRDRHRPPSQQAQRAWAPTANLPPPSPGTRVLMRSATATRLKPAGAHGQHVALGCPTHMERGGGGAGKRRSAKFSPLELRPPPRGKGSTFGPGAKAASSRLQLLPSRSRRSVEQTATAYLFRPS